MWREDKVHLEERGVVGLLDGFPLIGAAVAIALGLFVVLYGIAGREFPELVTAVVVFVLSVALGRFVASKALGPWRGTRAALWAGIVVLILVLTLGSVVGVF